MRVALFGEKALELERLDLGEEVLRLPVQLGRERFVRLLLDERDQPLGVLDLALQIPVGLVDTAQGLELGDDLLGGLAVVPEFRRRHLALQLAGPPLRLLDVKDSSEVPPGSGDRPRVSSACRSNP